MKRIKHFIYCKWTVSISSLAFILFLTLAQYYISCVLQVKEFNISAAISASVATTGVILTAFSYYKYKEEQKVKMTYFYNKVYRTDENIQEVLKFLIESDSKGTSDSNIDASTINKRELFFRFFEEIQYLIDQDIIDEKEAYDLFGYYAKVAYDLQKKFQPDIQVENNWKTLKKFIKGYEKQLR